MVSELSCYQKKKKWRQDLEGESKIMENFTLTYVYLLIPTYSFHF